MKKLFSGNLRFLNEQIYIWVLGENIEDGKVYVRSSNDEGKNLDDHIPIYFCPDHISSNADFFKLQKNNIISSYRLNGNLLGKKCI